jgi:CheY-like chemotaxis protein
VVLLPVQGEAGEEDDGVEAAESYQGYGKILVADDDSLVLETSKRLLTHLGFEVLTTEDGRECLERYALHRDEIRLVILDLTMPRMGGLETLRELRQVDGAVRVLLVSGYSDHGLDLPEDDGGLAFLQKPFRAVALEKKLRQLLDS